MNAQSKSSSEQGKEKGGAASKAKGVNAKVRNCTIDTVYSFEPLNPLASGVVGVLAVTW